MRSGPLSDKTAQDAVDDISNISYGALNGAFWCMVGHSGAQSDKSSPETVEKKHLQSITLQQPLLGVPSM